MQKSTKWLPLWGRNMMEEEHSKGSVGHGIVSPQNMFKSSPPLPVNVTLFGKSIFADLIKLRWVILTGLEWVLIQ